MDITFLAKLVSSIANVDIMTFSYALARNANPALFVPKAMTNQSISSLSARGKTGYFSSAALLVR